MTILVEAAQAVLWLREKPRTLRRDVSSMNKPYNPSVEGLADIADIDMIRELSIALL